VSLFARVPLRFRVLVPMSIIIGSLVAGGTWVFTRSETARTEATVAADIGYRREALLDNMNSIDKLVAREVRRSMKVLHTEAARQGSVGIAGTTRLGDRTIPNLTLGGRPLVGSYALVDQVKELVDGTATIFVRSGDELIRVSTNVMKDDQRAVGTLLDPRGSAAAALLKGEPFYGMVDILGTPYLTGYEPMLDGSGNVIGAWYVGYSLRLTVLAVSVGRARFLETGFAAVIDGKGTVRFHSEHVDDARVIETISSAEGWVVESGDLPQWNFKVVTAYPKSEAEAVAWARSKQVVIAALIGWAIIMGLLDVMLYLLVLRPLGGEPDYARKVCQQIAAGDLSEPVRVTSRHANSVLAAMKSAQESVRAMATDTSRLVEGAQRGDLAVRADATQHNGEYRSIVEGLNATLDAVVGPLNVAAEYMARIGHGDVPEPIEQEYRGDFNTIKASLNAGIGAIRALINDANRLAEAAQRGELNTRADASRHQGDYRRIVDGVNRTLDAVIAPLRESKRAMLALSEGDLTQRVDGHYAGEFAILQDAVNGSLDRLNGLVSQIKTAALSIDTSAREISEGNASLSQRTEAQASSLEETNSSMEQMSASVQANADTAREASVLAQSASDVAGRGGTKVQDVVGTMGRISTGARKMADIIATIDAIAFQTNILALNAAVEAARAGDQGRGFAVVAGEVRSLAQRSATAAQEIRVLITESTDTVGQGAKLVAEAGSIMEQIVGTASRVTDMVGAIAVASNQQSVGVAQVAKAVAQIETTTQQNSALVDESAASAESLAEQARALLDAVSRFQTMDAELTGLQAA
jgi:methyl-accepting chemotaxis protein